MVGRPGIGRMNERGRPTCHEFVSELKYLVLTSIKGIPELGYL
jgi:hypothetical protein